ncbi:MAG: response regulator transcription factor [Candidatus Wallbacteria bacterium]|nr:response regulator transcription factor [Candidatus Wallbacteria bacterium]
MTTVFVVEDNEPVRKCLCRILTEGGLTVSGSAGSGTEFLENFPHFSADVVLMDYFLPVHNAGEVLKRFGLCASVPVLVITGYPSVEICREVFACGAQGFISKLKAMEELPAAVRLVKSGGRYVTAEVADWFNDEDRRLPDRKKRARLSDRETQVLSLMVAGLTAPQIAEKLGVKETTVYSYKERIYRKTGCRNLAELLKNISCTK